MSVFGRKGCGEFAEFIKGESLARRTSDNQDLLAIIEVWNE